MQRKMGGDPNRSLCMAVVAEQRRANYLKQLAHKTQFLILILLDILMARHNDGVRLASL